MAFVRIHTVKVGMQLVASKEAYPWYSSPKVYGSIVSFS